MSQGMSTNLNENRFLFAGCVSNTDDTALLERIRAYPEQEKYLEIISSLKDERVKGSPVLNNNLDDIREDLFYTDYDPFCFIPLLPININPLPSVDDYVHLIYYNSTQNIGRKRQFYIKGPISSITSLGNENCNQSKSVMGSLPNVKMGKNEKNASGYFNTSTKGVMANPEDFGIYSKGKSDIILRDNSIILRAKKTNELKFDVSPTVNKNRTFLQLSDFDYKTSPAPSKKIIQNKTVSQPIVKLLEYEIDFGLDTQSGPYSGSIQIYNLPGRNDQTLTNTFNRDTVLENYDNFFPVFSHDFFSINSLDTVAEIINKVIKGLNDGEINFEYTSTINNEIITTRVNQKITGTRFPFFYRPSISTQNLINNGNTTQIGNLTTLISQVVFPSSNKENPGAGLISSKNKFGQLFETSIQNIIGKIKNAENQSYAVLGSDKIFFISRSSQIKGKPVIQVDDEDVYEISEEKLSSIYTESTEGIVRGESLKNLLSLIVRFLLNHQHLYHRLPPYEVTTETSPLNKTQVSEEFNLFDEKVINQNIRIN